MPSTESVGEAVPARAAAGQDGGEATWDVTGYGAVSIIASGATTGGDPDHAQYSRVRARPHPHSPH